MQRQRDRSGKAADLHTASRTDPRKLEAVPARHVVGVDDDKRTWPRLELGERRVSQNVPLVVARRDLDARAEMRPAGRMEDGVGHELTLHVVIEKVLPEPACRREDSLSCSAQDADVKLPPDTDEITSTSSRRLRSSFLHSADSHCGQIDDVAVGRHVNPDALEKREHAVGEGAGPRPTSRERTALQTACRPWPRRRGALRVTLSRHVWRIGTGEAIATSQGPRLLQLRRTG